MKELDAETKRILAATPEETWIRYYHELVIYAQRKCSRLYWRTGGRESLPAGYSDPEAIAREAVTRLFEGRRPWNHERYPGSNPVSFLKSIIDSLVSDLVRSEEHKRAASLEDETTALNAEGEEYEIGVVAAGDDTAGFRPQAPVDPEKAAYLAEMVERMEAKLADRPDVATYFRYSQEGYRPAEISRRMGLDIEATYQLKQLLVARLKPLMQELFTRGKEKGNGAHA
jgi:DNA-directed RNA polymerase specialized sigma24 family protein